MRTAALVGSLLFAATACAIKFDLPASYSPAPKCIWLVATLSTWTALLTLIPRDAAMPDTLVIITINVSPLTDPRRGKIQSRVDLEVLDGSSHRNVYQSKRGLKGETRIAVTSHTSADIGICLSNHVVGDRPCHLLLLYHVYPSPDIIVRSDRTADSSIDA
jgi:hypothetical protein